MSANIPDQLECVVPGIHYNKLTAHYIGNVFTYSYGGKQYVGVYSGVGGRPGIGMAAGLTESTAGLDAVGRGVRAPRRVFVEAHTSLAT